MSGLCLAQKSLPTSSKETLDLPPLTFRAVIEETAGRDSAVFDPTLSLRLVVKATACPEPDLSPASEGPYHGCWDPIPLSECLQQSPAWCLG